MSMEAIADELRRHAAPRLAPEPAYPGDHVLPMAPTLPVIRFADIQPALDSSDFVEGLLIDGGMTVIYGESGCGKTFYTLDLALHVAAGIKWRDRAVEQRGVLYLALEGKHGISNRVSAWKLAHDATLAEIPFGVVHVSVNLLHPDADTDSVIATAQAAASALSMPVGLIVVDTLSRAIAGGDENGPVDMGLFVRNVDRIRQALPAQVVIVHHSGKDSARGARGHGSLRAATDTEIEVTNDKAAKIVTARVTKQRELPGDDEFAFRLEVVTLGTDRRDKPVTSCVVRTADADPIASLKPEERTAYALLLELLAGHDSTSLDVGVWRDRFHARTRPDDSEAAKKKAWQRARDGLHAKGYVNFDEDRVFRGQRGANFGGGLVP